MRIMILIGLCLFGASACNQEKKLDRNLDTVYRDVLNNLLEERYFNFCLSGEKLDSLLSKKIDSLELERQLQLMKSARKISKPKCIVNYNSSLSKDLDYKKLITEELVLTATFSKDCFDKAHVSGMIDSLRNGANINLQNLENSYVRIVEFNKETQGSFGNGIGVLTFSKVIISKDNRKAILYYEFMCGPGCGDGVILLVERIDYKWSISKKIVIWNS